MGGPRFGNTFILDVIFSGIMEFGDIKFRLRKIVPVSTTSKKDPICSNYIYLSTNKAATFGRILSEEVQVRLLSKSTPLMISRKHATVYYDSEGESFLVTDHNVRICLVIQSWIKNITLKCCSK